MNLSFWQRLQAIDRRVIYVILLLFIIVPLLVPGLSNSIPIIPSRQSQDFYDTMEKVARDSPNKIVILDGWWSPSTRGENQWQTQAIITHMMKRRLHFAILSFDPQNNTLVQGIADDLAPKYGYVYGRDYINWGFKPSAVFTPTVKGLVTDIPGTIKKDKRNQPIQSYPVMEGVKTMRDVGAIVEVTPTASADTWLQLAQGVYKTPFLYAPTAVMAPTYYPYLDSGQISGMLTGVKGAGDYEKLTGTSTVGTRATGALSLVYALLIGLIILGNVGFYVTRRLERGGPQGGRNS